LGAYFFGDSEDSKDYVSIYLFSASPLKDKKITLQFTILVKNYISDALSVSKDFTVTFPVANGQGWGDRKAIKHESILSNSGFLEQDTLSIVCSIRVNSIEWDL